MRYLEIGTSIQSTFNKIKCERKVGMDPAYEPYCSGNEQIFKATSNDFFATNSERFQIVFIDGLHLYEQVAQDIINSWQVLDAPGFIILHDCIPPTNRAGSRTMPRRGPWTGDVYKAIIWFINKFPAILCKVLNTDYGLGFIHKEQDYLLTVDNLEVSLNPYKNYSLEQYKNNMHQFMKLPEWGVNYIKQ